MSAVPPEGFSKGEKQRSSLPWDESIRDAPPKKKAGPERKNATSRRPRRKAGRRVVQVILHISWREPGNTQNS